MSEERRGFGDLLRRLRTEAGLTQEEVAARSSLSIRSINYLERGAVRPRRQSAEALADALDLAPAVRTEFLARARERAPKEGPPAPVGGQPPARQLPADLLDFSGRGGELDELARLATGGRSARGAGRPAVLVITGMAGIGKTALAVHLAHRVARSFPDGQLFVDLHGTGGQRIGPGHVLNRFLRAVSSAHEWFPGDMQERAALYRSVMADRRCLVLLDDAVDEAQVRPLLPAGPGCLTIVTSRRPLTGIAGARTCPLGPLPAEAGLELLGRIAGWARLAAEPDAAAAVVRRCAGLPLALRIAGARLAARPTWCVGDYAARLADERSRLRELTTGDLAVRSALEPSYRSLPGPARDLFRRLGRLDGGEFGALDLAAPAGEVEPLLECLLDAQLIAPAGVPGRYRLHELVRLYAAGLPTPTRQPAASGGPDVH